MRAGCITITNVENLVRDTDSGIIGFKKRQPGRRELTHLFHHAARHLGIAMDIFKPRAGRCDPAADRKSWTPIVSPRPDRIRILCRDGYSSRRDKGSLHSCQIQLLGKKPSNPAYPAELNTLGDHLRKVRLDRGLSQAEVAKILKASETMVTAWELNRNQPTAKFAKAIIEFLKYVPFSLKGCSFGKRLYYARLIAGKNQKQIAKIIGCDASNLRHIELDQRAPQLKTREKIQDYFSTLFENIVNYQP